MSCDLTSLNHLKMLGFKAWQSMYLLKFDQQSLYQLLLLRYHRFLCYVLRSSPFEHYHFRRNFPEPDLKLNSSLNHQGTQVQIYSSRAHPKINLLPIKVKVLQAFPVFVPRAQAMELHSAMVALVLRMDLEHLLV